MSQNVIAGESRPTDLLGQNQSTMGVLLARQSIQTQQLQLTQGYAASLELAQHAAEDVVGRCRDTDPAQAGGIYRGESGVQEGNDNQSRTAETNTTMAAYGARQKRSPPAALLFWRAA